MERVVEFEGVDVFRLQLGVATAQAFGVGVFGEWVEVIRFRAVDAFGIGRPEFVFVGFAVG